MSDVIDISEPLREIADRLGLEYNCVKSFAVSPIQVTAVVYKTNGDGKKMLDVFENAVLEEFTFKVRT